MDLASGGPSDSSASPKVGERRSELAAEVLEQSGKRDLPDDLEVNRSAGRAAASGQRCARKHRGSSTSRASNKESQDLEAGIVVEIGRLR